MKLNVTKIEAGLLRSYDALSPWSDEYRVDFKRFKKSLDFLDKKNLIKDKDILDIGSGIGIMVSALGLSGARATGMDKFIFGHKENNFFQVNNPDKLAKVWKDNKISIVDGDVTAPLPFPDTSFDLVISDAFIEHLPESPRALFSEIHRVLRPGGYLFVTTPNVADLHKRLRFLLLGRSPHWDLKDYFDRGSNFLGHRREFSLSEVSRMMEWSDFKIADAFTANVYFNPARMLNPRKLLPQIFSIFSYPFTSLREMVFVLGRKI